jgi:hypothetical protein
MMSLIAPIPIAPHGTSRTEIDGVDELKRVSEGRDTRGGHIPALANAARCAWYNGGMTSRLRTGCAGLSQICAALVLLGCQSNPKHVSVVETAGAAGSYLVCLHDAAAALDDHVSEVSKIASAVADRCSGVFDAGTEALTRGMSPLKAAIVRHKAGRWNLKLAAVAVREERQEKNGNGHN